MRDPDLDGKVKDSMRKIIIMVICYCLTIAAFTGLLAYQRVLLVEARILSIYQTDQMLAAYNYLCFGQNQKAMLMLEKGQDISVNYLLYRKVMCINAFGAVSRYSKFRPLKITPELRLQLDEYTDEVFEKCWCGAMPNYYNVVDDWLLPKIFSVFVPVSPVGEVKRF